MRLPTGPADKIEPMTQLDVMYRYAAAPTEAAMMALGRVREVYGIRRLQIDEAASTVRVEYDATRLTESVVHQLLRRSGLDVVERVSLIPPPAATDAAPIVSAAKS
jgi:hypothetical protein